MKIRIEKLRTAIAALFLCGSVLLPLAACEKKGPFEKLGEEVDDAVDSVQDAVEDVVDNGDQ